MIFKKLVKLKMKKIRKWSLMLKLCLYFTINVEDTLWHIKKKYLQLHEIHCNNKEMAR